MPKRTTTSKTETTKPKASAKKTAATARKTTRSAVAPKRTARAPLAAAPSREAIARRAYELFEHRGGAHGSDQDDWFRAEAELRSELLG